MEEINRLRVTRSNTKAPHDHIAPRVDQEAFQADIPALRPLPSDDGAYIIHIIMHQVFDLL